MRFSILLPTRERLELLKYAVQSVLDQDFQDWEIVVSDNASEQDVAGFLSELGDPRVVYLRSDTLLTVTDNWNRALEHASGDYVLMLGDDDGLMRGGLSSADSLLRTHDDPELLYTDAIQYFYPGVLQQGTKPFTRFGYAEFLNGQTEPFWLSHDEAMHALKGSLRFKVVYQYNMQYSFVSRQLIQRLADKGPFFQSPYPDYYATNVAFLMADRLLVCPWPLVAVGVSPKSFGFFYFNQREEEGVDLLHNIPEKALADRVRSVVLPGTDMNTSWLLAMEALVMNYGAEYRLNASRRKYRFNQFRAMFASLYPRTRFLQALSEYATWSERIFWFGFLGYAVVAKLFGRRRAERIVEGTLAAIADSYPQPIDDRHHDVGYANLLEFVRAEDPRALVGLTSPDS
ncbi:MAG: glycosyltransferase family A protein [Coriobacteriia bacterium]|nr:glycosyltransferase family A protein [Coriobacteriia bacterium]